MTPPAGWCDPDRALTLALFRFGVIAELVEREDFAPAEKTALVDEIAERKHYEPGRGPRTVKPRTIWAWLAAHREGGLEALAPKERKDRGKSRVISGDVLARAVQLRQELPDRWTSTLIDILRLEKLIPAHGGFHRSTLDRHLALAGASRRQLRVLGSKRHIKMKFDRFGDLWVGDYHHGPPVIGPDGRPTIAKLSAFLDHCTRWPVADRYYVSETVDTLRDCMLRALLVWGPPRKVYVDRGAAYRAEQFAWSLDRLPGRCVLVHSKPYYSEGRGLIERWWEEILAFEAEVRARGELLTIHELNRLWEAWRTLRYCHEVHSALGRTPAEAIAEVTPHPIDPETARELFRVRAVRTVNKKDACVRVEGRAFLCESALRGNKVQVRYDPNDLTSVLVFSRDGRNRLQTAFPQPFNAPPEPTPERNELPQSVDYLGLLREEYDRRLLEHARPLAYADLSLDEAFDAETFARVVRDLAGLELRPSEKRELTAFWETVGPFPESLARIAVEHAVRLQGRGRHVRVYLNPVRTLVLAHWQNHERKP
ncbi:MAG: Mu transposase C-terminal domain-containing protein [Myxococcota bacterium]|nr:Mu transposase C-terminal domain-containing protein [Myxococcota bacterium]